MSKQTPMMQLREKINQLATLDAVINPLAIIHELATKMLPIEQQAFEDVFDIAAKAEFDYANYEILFDYEDGRDYYNQTFKS